MENFSANFLYSPLGISESTIRLVTLKPGTFFDPVRCELQHVNLTTKPKYEALSYVWGDPNATLDIELENQIFPITINLSHALRYLRRSSEVRILWIDAICIDQKNDLERNSQVQRMGDIYKSATQVVLWVGEEHIPYNGFRATIPIPSVFELIWDIARGHKIDNKLTAWGFTCREWNCTLSAFVNRSYWTRLWIVQEAVSNVSGELVCGAHSIPWIVFIYGFTQVLPSLKLTRQAAGMMEISFHYISTLQSCLYEYSNWKREVFDTRNVAERIVWLLFRLDGRFESRDAKDRIFAITSLLTSPGHGLSQTGLTIDYQKQTSQIFQDLTIFLLEQRGSLDILTHCNQADRLLQAPSWVPTWSHIENGTLRQIAQSRSNSNADAPPTLTYTIDGRILFLNGIIFDTIAVVGDEITVDSFAGFPADLSRNVSILTEFFQNLEVQYLESSLVRQKFSDKKMALNEWKHTFFHPEDADEMVIEHYCYEIMMHHRPLPSTTDDDNGNVAKRVIKEVENFATFKPFTLTNRRPIISSSGHIGVVEGVDSLEIGDIICLLRGSTIPFILRACNNHYRLVSACYMHSIMDMEEQERCLREYESVEFPLV